jgi:hypothetical protein
MLRVFDTTELRRLFRFKRDEVTGEWRRLHNEERNILYSSTKYYLGVHIKNEVGGACSTYGGEGGAGMLWGDRREGITWKTQTAWEDNIKMDLQEM